MCAVACRGRCVTRLPSLLRVVDAECHARPEKTDSKDSDEHLSRNSGCGAAGDYHTVGVRIPCRRQHAGEGSPVFSEEVSKEGVNSVGRGKRLILALISYHHSYGLVRVVDINSRF